MFFSQHFVALFCLLFGCPLNLLLIWLILCRTSKSARVWSWILLQTAALDLVNLLLCFIVQPMLISNGLALYLYSDGPFGQSNPQIVYFFFQFCVLFGELSKYSIASQFFYRWLVICRERTMTPRLYSLIIGIPILVALFLIIFMVIASGAKMSAECSRCPPDRSVIFMHSNEGSASQINSFLFMATNLAVYSIILATSCSIWRKTRSSIISQQKHSREFSRQIGLVLLVQAIMPLFFSLAPTFLMAGFIASKADFPDWISLVSLEPWPSILSPIATILIVGQYRRCLVKLISCRSSTTNTTSVQSIQIRVRSNNGEINARNGIVRHGTSLPN